MCVFTCLCLGPPRASHLGSGLKRNSLYWALPTCGGRTERKRRQRERTEEKGSEEQREGVTEHDRKGGGGKTGRGE